MSPKTQDLLVKVALLGAGGYLLYLLWQKFSGAATQAASVIANPIADAYSALTLPGAINQTSSVVLPNGTLINPASGNFLSVGNDTAQWQYNGTTYTLGARDANGNYPAS